MADPSPLSRKLQIKPNQRVLILSAPKGFGALLAPLPDGATTLSRPGKEKAAAVIAFATKRAELPALVDAVKGALAEGGVLWFCYPKRASGVESDLTRDEGWSPVFEAGFGPVSQVAIDDTWSALRFRPEADVERKSGSVVAPSDSKRGTKSQPKAEPAAPPDLGAALAASPEAKATWDGSAPSHKKEYTTWILDAKRPETRARRVAQAIEMLASGQKDRNAAYRR